MGKVGKYIYGVINSNTDEFFDFGGITAFADSHPLKSPTDVVNSSKILRGAYTISFQDISAVVSDSEIVDYSHMPKDTLAKLLVNHQQVIEKVMTNHTIIPMRLGTFANDDKEVRQILNKGYRTIKNTFERIKNCIEIDVVATFSDFDSFLQEFSEDEQIRQLKQSLLSKKGGITVDDQMKIGVLIKRQLDKKKSEFANEIQMTLNQTTDNFKAHDLMDDKMVFNTAFLINQSKLRNFERKVDELNNKFEEKLNFKCVGPLPPYSFYTLEVKKTQFEKIDWARKKLGLKDDFITAEDIKKTHRRLALICHPDKNPDTPGIEKKFDDMIKAYKILLDYYRASSQTEQNEGCYLNEQALQENAVLITTIT